MVVFALVSCKQDKGERKVGESGASSENDERQLISAEGRAYIWNVEHHVNLLKDYGLSRLEKAITSQDSAALEGILAPHFEGSVPESGSGTKFDSEMFSVRSELLGAGPSKLDRGKFVHWMLGRLAEVVGGEEGEPSVRTHVITLSPAERDQPDGRWEGTGKIEVASRASSGRMAELVLFFEFGVGKLTKERLAKPGWLTSLNVTRVRSANARQPLMREVAAERGIHTEFFWDNWKMPRERRLTNTGGVYLSDFNNDGLHDLFITDIRGSLFYVGEPGGRFREATRDLGIRGQLGGGFAAFVDLDGDGWEDLIHGVAHHPDGYRIYHNLNGRFFQDVTERSNLPEFLLGMAPEEFGNSSREQVLEKIQVKPTGISLADYDLDGQVDLYVTRGAGGSFKSGSWIDGKAGRLANNQLLRNVGGWQFEDVTNGSPLDGARRSSSNAVWLHANEDLRPDLYVIDEFGDGILLVNGPDGTFEGVELNDRPTDFGSMGMTAGDVNNDGHTDIYIGEMYSKAGERVMANIPPGEYDEEVTRKLQRLVDGSQLYLGGGDQKFTPAGSAMGVNAVGWAWGPCLADLNNDGWLDLYATAGFISQDRGKPDG